MKVVSSLAAVLLLSIFAHAKLHPVPLSPDTPSEKCIECHQEKAAGANVHAAVTMGCTTCHEILKGADKGSDVTRIRLVKPTSTALCTGCHEQMKSGTAGVHPPVSRNCLSCHDPHTSANKALLKKAAVGAKGENLCLDCHNQGVNTPDKGSRHAALDMGCATCHITHKGGADGNLDTRFHLTKSSPALCVDCHDPNDAKLATAHNNQPFSGADCIRCHDPHESRSPKLMQSVLHSPFESKACDSCHQAPKDGKVVLTNSDSKAMCVACHSEQAEAIEKASVQHPGAGGACTDCHDAHASKSHGLLKPDPVSACTGCHTEEAEQHKKLHAHEPAFQQGCAVCHEGHGSNTQHLLRSKSVNALCLECHGPDVEPQKLEADHQMTIFDGKVRLPENYFRKVPVLPIKNSAGHPVDHHPISDVIDLAHPGKVKTQLNCLTCHQAHSSSQRAMLVKDQEPNAQFCKNCHTNPLNLKAAGTLGAK